jgi:hypothetical protein
MFGKVGYKFGQHAVSLAYELGKDQAASGVKGTVWNVAYVWNPVRWAEIYAAYQIFGLDDFTVAGVGVDAEDINVAVLGTRIRF